MELAVEAVVPKWLRSYRRDWVGADAVAGLVIWSVVTPQCLAYAQIAGLTSSTTSAPPTARPSPSARRASPCCGAQRLAPKIPGTLVVLALGIGISAALHLSDHGVDVIGKLPSGLPRPSVPNVGVHDLVALLPDAFGVMLVSTGAVGVARAPASQAHDSIDADRELIALGGSNLLPGCRADSSSPAAPARPRPRSRREAKVSWPRSSPRA
jgi:MFS superfamily sulfate permease-like transporter